MKNVPIRAFNNASRTVLKVYPSIDPEISDPLHFLEDSTTAMRGFRIPYRPIFLADEISSQHTTIITRCSELGRRGACGL
jgi:hypothetical protein